MTAGAGADAGDAALGQDGVYSPEDLIVTARSDLPGEGLGRMTDQLPTREIIYRLAREQSGISLAELARAFQAAIPGGARPPYSGDPAVYVLRLLAGHRADLPPLASLDTLVRLISARPGPEPDYGFEVTTAGR